jgi:hypothetical protein
VSHFIYDYTECHYAGYHYAECHYAECHFDECRGAKCTFKGQFTRPTEIVLSFSPLRLHFSYSIQNNSCQWNSAFFYLLIFIEGST